jgi:hypothetical protein
MEKLGIFQDTVERPVDVTGVRSTHDNDLAAHYDRLLKLEHNVYVTRALLQEEERILYVDVINEMKQVFLEIQTVRSQQQCRHTTLVRSSDRASRPLIATTSEISSSVKGGSFLCH